MYKESPSTEGGFFGWGATKHLHVRSVGKVTRTMLRRLVRGNLPTCKNPRLAIWFRLVLNNSHMGSSQNTGLFDIQYFGEITQAPIEVFYN